MSRIHLQHAQKIRREFADEVAKPESDINLARAALLIAAEDNPKLDIEYYLRQFDIFGTEAQRQIAESMETPADAFCRFVFEELGFAGNRERYYDPKNSFLNEVLETRCGIPITLAVVFIEIANRAGLKAEGIGFPAHFLARLKNENTGDVTLIDVFNQRIIDIPGCQQLLDELSGNSVRLQAAHLLPVTKRIMLLRILANLKALYWRVNLYKQTLAVVERILLVSPTNLVEKRDRSLLLARLGRISEAIAEAQTYLELAPVSLDSEKIRKHLNTLRQRQATQN